MFQTTWIHPNLHPKSHHVARQFLAIISKQDDFARDIKPSLYYEIVQFDWRLQEWVYYRGRPEEGDRRELRSWSELPIPSTLILDLPK